MTQIAAPRTSGAARRERPRGSARELAGKPMLSATFPVLIFPHCSGTRCPQNKGDSLMKLRNIFAASAAAALALSPVAAPAAAATAVAQEQEMAEDGGVDAATVVGISFFLIIIVIAIFVNSDGGESTSP